MKEEYVVDDRIIIPDFIDKMTDEELDAFIAKKEKEARERNAKSKAVKAAAV